MYDYRNLSYDQTVWNLPYNYFEFGICPMPEFGICPTIISSSESVRRLSSESVKVAVGIEFQNPFPSHSHRISVGIPTKTHRKKPKNPKKNPRSPQKNPTKPTGKLGIIVGQIPNSGVGQIQLSRIIICIVIV